jgi:hypothetical protein
MTTTEVQLLIGDHDAASENRFAKQRSRVTA